MNRSKQLEVLSRLDYVTLDSSSLLSKVIVLNNSWKIYFHYSYVDSCFRDLCYRDQIQSLVLSLRQRSFCVCGLRMSRNFTTESSVDRRGP